MALSKDEIRNNIYMWILDESDGTGSEPYTWGLDDGSGIYNTYRKSLKWRLWNRRVRDTGFTNGYVGDNLDFTDGIHGQGRSAGFSARSGKLLSGNYKEFNPISGQIPSERKDYIVDTSDPAILSLNNPYWQYTWIAIQNKSVIGQPGLIRLEFEVKGCDQNISSWSISGGDAGNTIDFTSIKMLGIVQGTYIGSNDLSGMRSFLNSLTVDENAMSNENSLSPYFPHLVYKHDYSSNKKNIFWNACGENPALTSLHNEDYATVFHGYNNNNSVLVNSDQAKYIAQGMNFVDSGLDKTFFPPIISYWAYKEDPDRNKSLPSDSSALPGTNSQIFDLNVGETLFAIVCRTNIPNRGGDIDKNGAYNGYDGIYQVAPRDWHIWDIKLKYKYVQV